MAQVIVSSCHPTATLYIWGTRKTWAGCCTKLGSGFANSVVKGTSCGLVQGELCNETRWNLNREEKGKREEEAQRKAGSSSFLEPSYTKESSGRLGTGGQRVACAEL